jgi:hypothetical protein
MLQCSAAQFSFAVAQPALVPDITYSIELM